VRNFDGLKKNGTCVVLQKIVFYFTVFIVDLYLDEIRVEKFCQFSCCVTNMQIGYTALYDGKYFVLWWCVSEEKRIIQGIVVWIWIWIFDHCGIRHLC